MDHNGVEIGYVDSNDIQVGGIYFSNLYYGKSVCGDSSCEIYMGVSLAEFEGKI